MLTWSFTREKRPLGMFSSCTTLSKAKETVCGRTLMVLRDQLGDGRVE